MLVVDRTYQQKANRGLSVCAVVVGVSVMLASCDRSPSRSTSAGASPTATLSIEANEAQTITPFAVAQLAHYLRHQRDWEKLESLIVEPQRIQTVALIQTVDQLIFANQKLTNAVRTKWGSAAAIRVNRPGVMDLIGVFSQHVEFVTEDVGGDEAVVTIQVAGRVPLDEVRLVRHQGAWLIQTDEPIEGMAELIQRLASVLRDLAKDIAEDKYDQEQLISELKAREAPIVRRMADLAGEHRDQSDSEIPPP